MKTEKKQIFLMLLPSILLFMIYYWVYLSDHFRAVDKLKGIIEALTLEVSKFPLKLAQDKKNAEQLQEKMPLLREEISKTQQQMTQFEKSFQKTNSLETLFQINQILTNNKLVLIKSDFQNQSSNVTTLDYYEDMQFEKNADAETGKLLKLEIIGSFENFSKMMSDFNKIPNCIFPVNITMRNFTKKKNLHQWQLTLWI